MISDLIYDMTYDMVYDMVANAGGGNHADPGDCAIET